MEKIKALGAMKRFGPRYGRSLKHKFGLIELDQKNSYKCPECHSVSVTRKAAGIWHCCKCGATITGKAYSISEKVSFKENIAQAPEKKEQAEEQ